MTPKEELEELRARARMEDLERRSAPPSPDAQHAAAIAPHIDPALPVTPQVLATQPATTHPGGDEAAQSDWAVRGADSAKGTTVVYEPTVNKAREELLSKPELVNALFPDGGITPEFIQMMDENSDIYKTYADHKWDEARWAAADSGQTLYRQSRMPWLGGEGSGLSPLSGLVAKFKASAVPALEGASAFVLGVDDSQNLGAGRRLSESGALEPEKQKSLSDLITGGEGTEERPPKPAGDWYWHPTLGWTPGEWRSKDSSIGGALEEGRGDEARTNELLIEEHPGLHIAGQLRGMFTPGGVLGALGKGASALTRGAGALASRLGGGTVAQGAAKLAGAGVAAATGGAALQAGREGVEAAANLGKTGETGTTLEEAAGRSVEAGLDPVNLGLGVGGEALGMAAGRVAKGIANSPRYGGNVERVEQLGGKIKFGKGPVGTPGAESAIATGKARDISGQDVLAQELAPKIAAAEKAAAAGESAVAKGQIEQAKKAKEQAKVGHAEFKERYFQTPEGQQILPPTETIGTNLKMLRQKMVPGEGGALRPIGDATGVAPAKGQFNADIQAVSLKPSPGALELTPDEAEMFLAPTYQRELLPKPKGGPPPAGKPPAGGPQPNKQGVNVIKPQVPVGEAPTVPPKGKAAKPAGEVKAPPARQADTVKIAEEYGHARNEYGEAMRPYREAQRADNARAEKLAEEDASWSEAVKSAGKTLLPAVAIGSAAALASDEESGTSGAAAAAGYGLLARLGRKQPNLKRTLARVSKRTAQAIKALTPEERKAISGWSSSSYHIKEAYRRTSETVAERRANLEALGYEGEALERGVSMPPRKGDTDQVRAMDGAIQKLAINNPTEHGSMYRAFAAGDQGYRMPGIDDILTKNTFVNRSPIATSYNPEAVDDFYEKALGGFSDAEGLSPVVLEFTSVKRAAPRVHPDIQTLSEQARQREAEVIIPPGSTFRVVSREQAPVTLRGQKLGDPRYTKMATVVKLEQVENAPPEAWKDAAMIAAMLGIGAATGDEQGAGIAASAGGLALALKKRGVGKVYVTPRRYNAQQHEVRIGQLKTLAENPQMPGAREARELYAAALKDRQQRPLGGKPGGWANTQKALSDRLSALDEGIQNAEKTATKKEAAVLKKTPEAAHKKLVRYGQQRKGELPLKQEIEATGRAAGVLPQLQDLRLIDPLEQLRNAMVTRPGVSRTPASPRGFLGATVDNMALRGLYPGLKSASGEMSPLRGGMLGQRIQALGDNTPEEEER